MNKRQKKKTIKKWLRNFECLIDTYISIDNDPSILKFIILNPRHAKFLEMNCDWVDNALLNSLRNPKVPLDFYRAGIYKTRAKKSIIIYISNNKTINNRIMIGWFKLPIIRFEPYKYYKYINSPLKKGEYVNGKRNE